MQNQSFAPILVAAFLFAGCNRVEDERRDVAEAQSDLSEAERKASAAKADVNREAAKDRADSDRPVADAKEKLAEERADVVRAEDDAALKAKRDQAPTPEDQGGSESDRSITAQVRRDVVADDQLGMSAKNATIVTRDGVVTLRGPVATSKERVTVESYAKRATGVRSVDNQLELASK